jgi:hypothetical protein
VLRYTSFFFLIFFLSGAPSGAFELRYTSFFFSFFALSGAFEGKKKDKHVVRTHVQQHTNHSTTQKHLIRLD